ncbi:MAG: hypothetical protein KatS3mg011_1619 [Acidimicrobiia bacterium]|nr:MAG: hypothetical protein KatS3mg011_1619 [Acidimicrobiia bacterium]
MGSVWLFVYGTLRPGGSAFETVLGDRVLEIRSGRLPDHGLYGRGLPYPFVAPLAGGQVVGELLRVPVGVLAETDRYEGPEYSRVEVDVLDEHDRPVRAWTYLAARPERLSETSLIASGDWFGA